MAVNDNKIVVRSGDDIIVFVGNPSGYSLQSDNTELVSEVKEHMKLGTAVPIVSGKPYFFVAAGSSSWLSLIAAMFAPNPGGSLLLEAPEKVLYDMRQLQSEGPSHLFF